MNDTDLLKQLEVAFGSKKAKQLLKKVQDLKKQNPDARYSFIFGEDGTMTAIRKSADE